jgi:hypothetical protein
MEPGAHALQIVTLDSTLYWPAAQGVHVVAPPAVPVFVIDPAAQLVHAVVDAFEYRPAAHAVQVVAVLFTTPVPAPASATDPAGQTAQAICDDWLYWPGLHAMQDDEPVRFSRLVTEPGAHALQVVTLDSTLYWPAAQGVHVVAPPAVPVFVIDPAAQLVHAAVDAFEYRPAAHAVQVVAVLFTTPVPAPASATDPAGQTTHGPAPPPVE